MKKHGFRLPEQSKMKNALILPRFATGIFQFCDYNYDDFRAWAAYPQKIFKIKGTCELAIHAPFSSLIQPKFTQSFFRQPAKIISKKIHVKNKLFYNAYSP